MTEFQRLKEYEKNLLHSGDQNKILANEKSFTSKKKTDYFTMKEQKQIFDSLSDYDQLYSLINQNLKYYKGLDKALQINYEFINEQILLKRENKDQVKPHNPKLMEKSLDTFSQIIFHSETLKSHSKQQEVVVSLLAQFRHNLRQVIGRGDLNDVALDLNANFSNLIFYSDFLASHWKSEYIIIEERLIKDVEYAKVKRRRKLNKTLEELNKLKTSSSEAIQELKTQLTDMERERNQLEIVVKDQEDYIKSLSSVKTSDELNSITTLTKSFDKFLDRADLQRQQMIQNLKKMSTLCDFKKLEEENFLRIQNRGIQTDEIGERNFIMQQKIETNFRSLKPFIHYFPEKTLLDSYSTASIQRGIQQQLHSYMTHIPAGGSSYSQKDQFLATVIRMFLMKTQSDLQQISDQDTGLVKFPLFMTSFLLEENKISQITINQLCGVVKQLDDKAVGLQMPYQLLYLFLGYKRSLNCFTFPHIQHLFISLYYSELDEDFEISLCQKLLLRVQKLYPTLCYKDQKKEKIEFTELLIFFQMLRGHFKDLRLWDFQQIFEDIEKSKKMVENILFAHAAHLVSFPSFNQEGGDSSVMEQIKRKRKSLLKSMSVTDINISSNKNSQNQFFLEAGKQLINDLFYLIVNFFIRNNEAGIWKKLKTAFESMNSESQSTSSIKDTIYTEQLKDVLRYTFGDVLSEFLILVVNEFILNVYKEKQISILQLQNYFKRNMNTSDMKISREIMIRLQCYKVFMLLKKERRKIQKLIESQLDESHSLEQVRMHLFNFNSFKVIIQDIAPSSKLSLIVGMFKELNEKLDSQQLNDKNELVQVFLKIVYSKNLLLRNQGGVSTHKLKNQQMDSQEQVRSPSPTKTGNNSGRLSISGQMRTNMVMKKSSGNLPSGFARQGTIGLKRNQKSTL